MITLSSARRPVSPVPPGRRSAHRIAEGVDCPSLLVHTPTQEQLTLRQRIVERFISYQRTRLGRKVVGSRSFHAREFTASSSDLVGQVVEHAPM
jgi:hypothetical protein